MNGQTQHKIKADVTWEQPEPTSSQLEQAVRQKLSDKQGEKDVEGKRGGVSPARSGDGSRMSRDS